MAISEVRQRNESRTAIGNAARWTVETLKPFLLVQQSFVVSLDDWLFLFRQDDRKAQSRGCSLRSRMAATAPAAAILLSFLPAVLLQKLIDKSARLESVERLNFCSKHFVSYSVEGILVEVIFFPDLFD